MYNALLYFQRKPIGKRKQNDIKQFIHDIRSHVVATWSKAAEFEPDGFVDDHGPASRLSGGRTVIHNANAIARSRSKDLRHLPWIMEKSTEKQRNTSQNEACHIWKLRSFVSFKVMNFTHILVDLWKLFIKKCSRVISEHEVFGAESVTDAKLFNIFLVTGASICVSSRDSLYMLSVEKFVL